MAEEVRPRIDKQSMAKIEAIVARTEKGALSKEDHEILSNAMQTLACLTSEIGAKDASISRLRKLIWGPCSEKTDQVLGGIAQDEKAQRPLDQPQSRPKKPKKKPKGHGKNGAEKYTGAEIKRVAHESLRAKEPCPECVKGKLYEQKRPAVLVRITGMAPIAGTVWECQRVRCNLCGKTYTAKPQEDIGTSKYDEKAAAMIALLKYGCGLPFNRIERLQRDIGIPFPASTQWDVVSAATDSLTPAYKELIRQAAQGKVLHNDDTTMKILGFTQEERASESIDANRVGVFTSGIAATNDEQQIALFFTGLKHAGERLADVLEKRESNRGPPIQMCDALSRNTKGDFETIVSNCIAHARRRFVDVVPQFPEECSYVLQALQDVYHTDKKAREAKMSEEERLKLHQDESAKPMDELKSWLSTQIDDRKVEPNSSLGQAITYMRKHWEKLTLFLSVAGAPLDNNLCERILKKAILHRKNSLFYKSMNGARAGDLYMSLIHSAELCDANPFDYLVELQRNPVPVKANPQDWMPWNYRENVTKADGKEA